MTKLKPLIKSALVGALGLGPAGVVAQSQAETAAAEIAEIVLEARVADILGQDWSVSSQFRPSTESAYSFWDVTLQREDIIIQIRTLSALAITGQISGRQVRIHKGSLESFPILEFEHLSLGGEGLGGKSFSELECQAMKLGEARPILSASAQGVIAQPDPALRIPGARSLGETRAHDVQGTVTLTRQSEGCVLELLSDLDNLQITSGLDNLRVAHIDLTSKLPVGDGNDDRGSLGVGMHAIQMSGPTQSYEMNRFALEASVPRPVVAAYLPFWYAEDEREMRFREILFEYGADLWIDINGLDLDLNSFMPGGLARSHLEGDAQLQTSIRKDRLESVLILDFPNSIEVNSDVTLSFSDNVMGLSALQIPFMTNLEGLGLRIQSDTLLQDITRLTGLRLSQTLPQIMTERMKEVPLIGGAYDSEISAIGDWLALIEGGERGHVELRPIASVNLGMVAGLFVADMGRALSTLGFSVSPELP